MSTLLKKNYNLAVNGAKKPFILAQPRKHVLAESGQTKMLRVTFTLYPEKCF